MVNLETYRVVIKGTRPLLMHAPVGISDKPELRRGEHLDPKTEAEMYIYKDIDGKICIPARMIEACLRNAGRGYKVRGRGSTFGAMIRAGILIEPEMIPLIYEGNWEIDYRPVVLRGDRIMRARPKFNNWKLEFKIINLDPTIIHAETLHKIIVDAGKYYGLGDFRPKFGLFKVEIFEKE